MLKNSVIAVAALAILAGCEETGTGAGDPAPAVTLTAEESQAVGTLAQGIASDLSTLPRVTASRGFEFMGAEAVGTRVVITERAPYGAGSYTTSSINRFRAQFPSDLQQSLCDPDLEWRSFFLVGGEVEVRIVDSGRRLIARGVVNRC